MAPEALEQQLREIRTELQKIVVAHTRTATQVEGMGENLTALVERLTTCQANCKEQRTSVWTRLDSLSAAVAGGSVWTKVIWALVLIGVTAVVTAAVKG